MFFRIERTGPPGGGPARSLRSVPCPHPHTFPAWPGTGNLCLCLAGPFIFGAPLQPIAFARSTCVNRPSWKYPPAPALSRTPPRATRSRVPRSQRLRRRRFAPFHTDRSTPLSCSVPLLTASHPRVGAGNVSRPLLRVGPAIPPPTPTPAHGTHCPPIRAYGASAFGAISVPPDLSGPLPSVHSPLHLSDSALSVSARYLPAKSTS